jgi:hypothetical protein
MATPTRRIQAVGHIRMIAEMLIDRHALPDLKVDAQAMPGTRIEN